MKYVIITLLALAVGILYLLDIRRNDIYEKEPFGKLLIAFIGGLIIAPFITFLFSKLIGLKGGTLAELSFLNLILKVGAIEEFSKFIILIIIYPIIKKDFNEIVDGIIYISAIALGFSINENIFYAIASNRPFINLLARSLTSTFVHMAVSIYMGIAFYIHKKVHRNYIGILLSILLAALAHGIYDAIVFNSRLIFLFYLIFPVLLILQIHFYRTILGFSKFREPLTQSTFEETGKNQLTYCANCNKEIRVNNVTFKNIKAGICFNCGNIVLDFQNSKKFFKYFRPIPKMKKILKHLPKKQLVAALDENENILINKKEKMLSANVVEFGNWLEENNINDKLRVLKIPIIGFILKQLGLKYLVEE